MKYQRIKRSLAVLMAVVFSFTLAPIISLAEDDIPADGISVSESSVNLCIGDEFALTASVLPSGATNRAYTWSSSETNVATVSEGVVTAISIGTAEIIATSDDGGYTDSCTVKVIPQKICSQKYAIEGGVLRYVSAGTSAAQLLGDLDNGPDSLAVFNGGGEYTGSAVGTGMTVRLTVNSTVRDEVAVIARGDVDGDGVISIIDYTLMRQDILALTELLGLYGNAADVDKNGQIDIADYTMIRLHILGIQSILGDGHTPPEPTEDPRRQMLIDFALTQLGKPYVLGGKGPDVFDCSGFVYYCLNSIGYEIGYMTSTTWRSANFTTITNMNEIEKGDILCFYGHVGIYMGDGQMVDASSTNGMIVTRSNIFGSTYWTENFVCAKRVFD